MLEGVADVRVLHTVPTAVGRMRVEVAEDGSRRSGAPLLEARGNPAKGFGRAEERVRGGPVADLLTPDGILLVSEGQSGIGDARDERRIIQRCRRGVVDHVPSGEMDML